MNLSKFQLSLNHEDPAVVIRGLEEFQEHMIEERYTEGDSFGYHGRQQFLPNYHSIESIEELYLSFSSFLHPNIKPLPEISLLSQYLQASPLIDDLFVLWNLPDRDSVSHITTFML